MAQRSIVICATSADDMNGHATGCWMEELTAAYYTFQDAKFNVVVASVKGGKVPFDAGSVDKSDFDARYQQDEAAKKAVENSIAIADIKLEDHAAIYFPGGHGTCVDFPTDKIGKVVMDAWKKGLVVGTVCHGPCCLINAKFDDGTSFVKGKKVCAFTNGEEKAVGLVETVPFLPCDKLETLGAELVLAGDWTAHAVVDGKLVTGQNPMSSELCAKKMVELL